MTEWLAVIAFCVGNECAFWAETKFAYPRKEDCEARVLQMEAEMKKHGAVTIPTCIPLRFVKA
jgi:hypothetical protein